MIPNTFRATDDDNDSGLSDRVSGVVRDPHLIVGVITALVILAGVTGIVASQEGLLAEDDFEDGTVDGWVDDYEDSPMPQISTDSYYGNYALYDETIDDRDTGQYVRYQDSPILSMEDEFAVTGTIRPNHYAGDDLEIRAGIFSESGDDGTNAIIAFDDPEGVTYLTTDVVSDPEDSEETIDDSFNDEWVDFEIHSPGDEETIYLKVWPSDEAEPDEYQVSEDFEGVSGTFTVHTGNSDEHLRELWLDRVQIEGTEAPDDEDLSLDAPALLQPGSTYNYSVTDVGDDVTEDAEVTSHDTAGLTVDEDEHLLEATDDENYSNRIELEADYDDRIATEEVAVATIDVENLEVLPPAYRFAALIGDSTIQVLILSIFAGVVGSRWTTAFGGLGLMEMTIVVGWFGGYVGTGIALVSVFTAMFIGFNLAANIDYTVRR